MPRQFLFIDKSPLVKKNFQSSQNLVDSDSKSNIITLQKMEGLDDEDEGVSKQLNEIEDEKSVGSSPTRKIDLEDVQVVNPLEEEILSL
mmetsp:Transcript_35862/g.26642  ORF Transcript_35862/g.26642 Transcript_35862/m.26642 type:complete len:89 (-) Transcript_35862:4-270(-)|eukprot:CAMPEP_0202965268 /NCGR_PEP_ID=MMETSP1396-20130829/9300_1 /ASSEMBLY_ACC=CAM_ASM_000872 /TAXON_ID= /ORGANISM="Pseudokeronopsis sp., Strain Brazil" /LENGTH=88 /DNA_ID=CAMNT_0049687929 /DNA_START=1564 /DNA_END=1830 /DNA_ORIENTATION=-